MLEAPSALGVAVDEPFSEQPAVIQASSTVHTAKAACKE
nr:hypothetical protein [uncultured bacterium]